MGYIGVYVLLYVHRVKRRNAWQKVKGQEDICSFVQQNCFLRWLMFFNVLMFLPLSHDLKLFGSAVNPFKQNMSSCTMSLYTRQLA